MAIKTAPPEPDWPNSPQAACALRSLWRLFGWGSAAADRARRRRGHQPNREPAANACSLRSPM